MGLTGIGRLVAREMKPERCATVAKLAPARFAGLRPSSSRASFLASRSSRKAGTACELQLAHALRTQGFRFSRNLSSLPGCPDLVFRRARVVVFVDGDFWHGRNWGERRAKLSRGHNSDYWIRKITSNVARDRRIRRQLNALGWRVLRVWECDVKSDLDRVVRRIARSVSW